MLLELTVTLSILFGPSGTTAHLDVNPTLLLDAPLNRIVSPPGDATWVALTLPHLILIDEDTVQPHERASIIREERMHAAQWSALGPLYPLAYAATLGRAFEPYDPLHVWRTGTPHDGPDWTRMWTPTPEQTQRCPLLRINNNGLHLLPCWTKGTTWLTLSTRPSARS